MTSYLICGVPPLGLAFVNSDALAPDEFDNVRTNAQAIQWMDEQGLSKAELARRFGVSCSLVDAILRGQKPCKRGASHNIAVFLGLKRGQAVAAKQPYTRPARVAPAQRTAAAQHAGAAA